MLLIEIIFANEQWSYINYCSSMLKRNKRFKKKLTTSIHTYCNVSRYIKSITRIGRFEYNCLPTKSFFLGFS